MSKPHGQRPSQSFYGDSLTPALARGCPLLAGCCAGIINQGESFMNHHHIIGYLSIALLATSCAPKATPELLAAASKPVICKAGDDCAQKWSKATQWVRNNCEYRFQTISDNVIQTMGPFPNSPSPAYIITKFSTSGDTYKIELGGGCANMFGCRPTILEAKASFATFMNAQ